jgi:hypothetical protein
MSQDIRDDKIIKNVDEVITDKDEELRQMSAEPEMAGLDFSQLKSPSKKLPPMIGAFC